MLKAEVIGNLGADVEIKNQDGHKFASFRVAHTEKWKDAEGKEIVDTKWIDVVISDVENKVIPYLKAGVKVFVRGFLKTRVYSSKKDRCIKAGVTITMQEIELMGGNHDEVPRQLIDPDTAQVFEVKKYYCCNYETKDMKKGEQKVLIDKNSNGYICNHLGIVIPDPEDAQADESEEKEVQK